MRRDVITLGLAAGLIFGLAGNEVRKFERAAAHEISDRLEGENRRVSVRTRFNGWLGGFEGDLSEAIIEAKDFSTRELPLFTEPNRSRRGKVRNLKLQLSKFRLGELDIERLEASIPDCRYDFGLARNHKKFRLSQSGIGIGKVWIRDEALERFILSKFKEIKSVSVKSDRGWIWVEGEGEFLILTTHFRVLAKLEPFNGTQLVLTRTRIAFDGLPADAIAAQAVLDTLNPVVDLNRDLKLHGAIIVEGVTTENGVLEAWGKTQIPEAPK